MVIERQKFCVAATLLCYRVGEFFYVSVIKLNRRNIWNDDVNSKSNFKINSAHHCLIEPDKITKEIC